MYGNMIININNILSQVLSSPTRI